MKKIKRQTKSALNLPSITLEGALFLPDQLEKAAIGQAKFQTEADYNTPKGLRLKDDYSRAFQIACAQWKHFASALEREDVEAQIVTQTFVEELLRDALGYSSLRATAAIQVNELAFPVTFIADHVPVVVAPFNVKLDDSLPNFAIEGSGSRKKSAFQLAQELLNASDAHLWAIVTNGKQLRLLRDAASLTRPSFLEVDLQEVLTGQRFSEFANIWRLLHASRAALNEKPEHSIWEAWRETGKEEGTRVRDGLRNGVERALLVLGEGFIQHPANQALRQQLDNGELTKDAYFQQLLRLIYRLIFLFTVEERGVLHPADDNKQAQLARRAYAQGYALGRLREACLKRRNLNRFDDHWQALRIIFKGLAEGEPRLALPALGGLFNPTQCQSIDAASLSNKHLLCAMRHLRWADHQGTPTPVDYRNMGPEELGSVYESLLELVPEIDLTAKTFGFIGITSEGSTAGNARKTSGSYYTPDSLVQELIKSALEPVIAQRLAENKINPTEAILSIRVIDPACGSGHFLLAAARRLAQELAQLRSEDGAVKPADYRHALREVVSHCIFGVDRNPMALELARTALWLESFEEDQPLSFLDHHLQCGDALLGLTNLKALEYGIPKAAFKPLSGDEKTVCTALNKTNTAALKQLEKDRKSQQFNLPLAQANQLAELQAIEAMPQTSTKQIDKQEKAYKAFLDKAQHSHLRYAADMVLGAFLLPKTEATENHIPTTASVYLELVSDSHNAHHIAQREAAMQACVDARVFHWPLAFPQVFAQGGFDCVLGNPPWERIKLQEEEFFATRNADVAKAKNKAERAQRIQWLSEGMLARHLLPDLQHSEYECAAEVRVFNEFLTAKRTAEAASAFMHVNGDEGGRYPLTGVGDVNTYALFSETIYQIVAPEGRAGFIVPSGLATDNSTKDFFGELISKKSLDSFFEFENEGFFSGAGQGHMLRFALTTIVGSAQEISETRFLFQGKNIEHLHDPERVFTLSPQDIFRVNPNTLTCPIFQSRYDAEITKKIYQRVPVLIREANGDQSEENPWGIRFMAMFHMSNDSHLFKTYEDLRGEGYELHGNHFIKDESEYVPLYEAKMVYHYNHRYSDFSKTDGERAHILPKTSLEKLKDMTYEPIPFYWVKKSDMEQRYVGKNWGRKWALGFRDVTDSRASARSFVGTVIPYVAVGNKYPLMLIDQEPRFVSLLQANLTSICFDYFSRQKIGGLTMNFFIVKQLPVLPPEIYSAEDIEFISSRVIKITYSSYSMKGWAQDLGFYGNPFEFNEEERTRIQAELDAYFAKLYGLSREELQFILDPESIKPGYPSETFAVLKRSENRLYDEYRTQRLVLEAWDKLEAGELH
ncbi:Eco57I restriction-modification methylase domain-containing protein [Acinetobacter soli]|uniref:Eco57I restriction-modification methylase domain-containing protein n=1 Tax=Acinetobacter soli TaxID=487316 RepID=UPI00124E1A46|nr:N-6 DNA methylase [Acinetobacter soli]